MVQGEINTAISPSIQNQTPNPNVARLYENINNNNTNNFNMNNNDSNGEKKKKVGNYIISKTIGEGSFAKVRLGYHLITQQMVAVKVINKKEVLKRNYLRANLRREACMMQRMQHPHIIQLFEVMETENCYYIVMELIDGIEFVKYLSKKRSLDENETRNYIRQICSAVDHMHRAKVVHRDIKLQNFMLDQNHNLTIIDFGLSNSLDEREFLNTQCGSPAYAAPEIFAHQDYGPEVDIWSIGVNMYAMLAGKLPFKVENRSKNLAKLHACILKGFEIPPFLTPDCQDLLCRLLDPSPNKRIKMAEIFTHPWLNYNSFPVEIIPYKPVVDIKEIKPQIVQYLVQKHEYSEMDIIDAIVYRKPVALKAVYYLIEKRLKQGLSFPDPDYSNADNEYTLKATNSNSNMSNNVNHLLNTNYSTNTNNNNTIYVNTNGTNGIIKQNSQLLPKRHTNPAVSSAQRSSSHKNIDFKSIYNNMNINRYNNNQSRESEINNLNQNSHSPSPDFIAAAMNPAKNAVNNANNQTTTTTTAKLASASSMRSSRQGNYPDVAQRKSNSNASNYSSTYTNNNKYNTTDLQQTRMQNSGTPNRESESRNENRYNLPVNNHCMSPNSEDSYQPIVYYQTQENGRSSAGLVNNNNNTSNIVNNSNNANLVTNGINSSSHNNTNVTSGVRNGTTVTTTNGTTGAGIRSLPSSLYRGSPERSLPRSPERHIDVGSANNYHRPTSRISNSRPSVSELQTEKIYDQKYKAINYLTTKRSLTSCDVEPNSFDSSRQKNSSSLVTKNRQLHMGKAKIDLETQPNLNVGVSIKNIGNYIKSTISRNNSDNLKAYNNLNMRGSTNLKNSNSNVSTMISEQIKSKAATAANLVHRHSNPTGAYSTTNSSASNGYSLSNPTSKPRTIQQSSSMADPTNALPRIRINS